MVEGHKFAPPTLTVTVGEAVTWTNDSSESHTVTAVQSSLPDGADYFSSGGATSESAARDDLQAQLIGPGGDYKMTFDTPGTYRYYCIPHRSDGMTGEIKVVIAK
jgi:plastocyanin